MVPHDPALVLFSMCLALTPPAARAASPEVLAPGGLRRVGEWGFRFAAGEGGSGGVVVTRLDSASAAARAGLRDGDRVLRLAGEPVRDPSALAAARRRWRAGDPLRLDVVRGGAERRVEFTLAPLPLERIPGCDVSYGAVDSPRGGRVRTIMTRPTGASGRLPVVLFVPWLSCDPVETPVGPLDGWRQLLHGLARTSGWMIARVEKPGVGDSEGGDCSTNDLETDLDAFRAALRALRARDDVDSTRIVLFGGSIGAALAPLLADEQPVAGLIVSGGFSRTWFEHMLEIERRRLTLQGVGPAEVNQAMRGFAEFYALYLGASMTPAEVLRRRPELKDLWYDAPDGQYGRPAAYYHQVARLAPEAAWSRRQVPVLVLYGEYDWIMSRAEHERIVEVVNAAGGDARLDVLPRTDHNLDVHPTPLDAFHGRNGTFDDTLVTRVATWLAERVR